MIKYNLDKLIRVRVLTHRESDEFHYMEERKRWWGHTDKEGIYYGWTGKYRSITPPINHTLTNSIVYENPRVILNYQGDIVKVYHFETYKEAEKFADKITNDKKWIE